MKTKTFDWDEGKKHLENAREDIKLMTIEEIYDSVREVRKENYKS